METDGVENLRAALLRKPLNRGGGERGRQVRGFRETRRFPSIQEESPGVHQQVGGLTGAARREEREQEMQMEWG